MAYFRPITWEEGWGKIKPLAVDRLQAVLEENIKSGRIINTSMFTPTQYVSVYTMVYDMCTQRSPHNFSRELYERHGVIIRTYLRETVLVALQEARSTIPVNNPLLSFLWLHKIQQYWTNHQIMTEWLRKFFTYVDREFVKRTESIKLTLVGMRAWKTLIFQPLQEEITTALLQVIAQERQEEGEQRQQQQKKTTLGNNSVDDDNSNVDNVNKIHLRSKCSTKTGLVKSMMEMFKVMSNLDFSTNHNAFAHDLEAPLIEATCAFYAKKRQEWWKIHGSSSSKNSSDCDMAQYLVQVEQALQDERTRLVKYFDFEKSALVALTSPSSRSNARRNHHDHHGNNNNNNAATLTTPEDSILAAIEHELLENMELDHLETACRVLLEKDQSQDLQGLFRLFLRLENQANNNNNNHGVARANDINNDNRRTIAAAISSTPTAETQSGLQSIADIFQQYVTDCGHDMVLQHCHSPGSSNNNKAQEKTNVVQAVMDLRQEYAGVVQRDFSSHAYFQMALEEAICDVVNHEAADFPSLLSVFCHVTLQKSSLDGGETLSKAHHDRSQGIIQLFGYLKDKDLFIQNYQHLLAQRLLKYQRRFITNGSNSMSNILEAEQSMIEQLKQVDNCACIQRTCAMEGMVADMVASQKQQQEFNQLNSTHQQLSSLSLEAGARPSSKTSLRFGAHVLTTAFWPTNSRCKSLLPHVRLTPDMSHCIKAYEEFYQQQYPKRRNLEWVLTQGTATVRATFNKHQRYDLQVSTLQALVLESLSGGVRRSVDDLVHLLNLELDILRPLLQSLCCGKHKVLTKVPPSNKKTLILSSDVFTANTKFSSQLRTIRFPRASRLCSSSFDANKVRDDRRSTIEAAIVRIMKARKILPYDDLLKEVDAQLSHLFHPNPRLVKSRIKVLIDLQFLERSTSVDDDNNEVECIGYYE